MPQEVFGGTNSIKNTGQENLQTLVERTANYEGDHTLLFLERLQNREVRKKLVESLAREYIFTLYRLNPGKGESRIDEIKAKLEEELNERIKKVFSSTGINLQEKSNVGYGGLGQTGTICPLAQARQFGIDREGPLSARQLNIVEAHEKGHGIRSFKAKSSVGMWIVSSLDFSNIEVPEADLAILRQFYSTKWPKHQTDEEVIKLSLDGLREEPSEIVERMSQLRNYFGMKGNEEFTKEHLDYARKNYIRDIGWHIQIKLFFDAITEESEKNFLDVINNLGV